MEIFELLKYDFFLNALISTLLIGISCGLVGTYIVAKRMVFISGGITHASFGGLGIAYYLGMPPMAGATVFALAAALGILFWGDSKKLRKDSLIGIFWSAGMAIGVLFIYLTPGYAPNLMSYLFGNILTITHTDILTFALYAAVLSLFVLLFYRPILYAAFDGDFARTQGIHVTTINACMTLFIAIDVVLSIRLIGIMLLISILSLPQMIAELFCSRYKPMMFLSMLIGFACGVTGLAISTIINVPTGASIVFTLVVVYAAAKAYSRIAMALKRKKQLRQATEQ